MKAVAPIAPLEVELAGGSLDPKDARCLESLEVRQRLSVPAQLEIAFRGVDSRQLDRLLVMVGLSAKVRSDSEGTVLFEGEITAIEVGYTADGAVDVRLRGYDPLHRLRKRQAARSFTDVDVAGIVAEVVGPIGLTVRAGDRGPTRAQAIQWRQADLEFLAELAASAGLYFAASPDGVELFTLVGVDQPAVELSLGDTLLEAEFEVNGEQAIDAVQCQGWDPTTGQRWEQTADAPRSGRTAGARVPIADLGGDGRRTLPNVVAREADWVEAVAQSGLDRAVGQQVVLRGVAAGSPAIRPGRKIDVQRVAPALQGEYLVTEAIHSFDAERGAITRFSTEPPAPAAPVATPLLLPGVVVAVDDPDRKGRVRVAFPTLSSVESGWLRVLLPGVGGQAGFLALPSRDDEVLVVCPSGDPAVGLVVGSLFGGDQPPDFGVVDGAVGAYRWRTREGQEIALDEANHAIKVATPNGSSIVIDRDRMTILAATDFELAAPGKTITIRAQAVDFQRAES